MIKSIETCRLPISDCRFTSSQTTSQSAIGNRQSAIGLPVLSALLFLFFVRASVALIALERRRRPEGVFGLRPRSFDARRPCCTSALGLDQFRLCRTIL